VALADCWALAGPDGTVDVPHLWASLCGALPEIGDWLVQNGWDPDRVRRLAAATADQATPQVSTGLG
jgi:hypothetical protein